MDSLKNLTVLYVEDDNEVRENIATSLAYFVKSVDSASTYKTVRFFKLSIISSKIFSFADYTTT